MLQGKKIILGITGSIAAYKAAFLLRLLMKEGAEVQVIITPAGKEFITPVTLSALSGKPVLGTFFENRDGTWHSHVDLGLWADLMLIAPASANTLAKMANGICDNLLLTTYLSAKCPVVIAPAMDLDMFAHPATQKNIEILSNWGCKVIEPGTGVLASGLHGKGRMEEPEAIVEQLKAFFTAEEKKKSFAGKRIMITAGPTHEAIDPVRFIGNYSSGKMGFAIAEELALRGAVVDLIAGPVQLTTHHANIRRYDVVSAMEMYQKASELFPRTNGAVMAAAVADFTPVEKAEQKIKRAGDSFTLEMKANPDIARAMGQMKQPGQVLAGFALETDNAEANAAGKLQSKNLDFIVLNSLADPGSGFMVDTNRITILDRENKKMEFPLKSKREVASDIVDYLEQCFGRREDF